MVRSQGVTKEPLDKNGSNIALHWSAGKVEKVCKMLFFLSLKILRSYGARFLRMHISRGSFVTPWLRTIVPNGTKR